RSVAARIASELGSEVGEAVGYRIRFSDHVGENTYVKLMTDGILLAEVQRDAWLNQYDTIIVDEAHERSLNIDFLLGYLKRLLQKRRDLKVIITSATIDPDRFSRHFNQAPVILAEGRSYPVEVRWQPPVDETGEQTDDTDIPGAIVAACESLLEERISDILVFLTGERDIREAADILSKHAVQSKAMRGVEIVPLFSRLSNAEQNRIFQKHNQRRIILSTNVAETSLTVPGIRAVVDAGYARLSRYSVRSKVQRLPIEKISQASADQRKGRCGREAPGVCIRLYTEEDYLARPAFTEPEILRTNLAAVILQMASMRLGQVEDFPFLEAPETRFVNDGYRTLQELAAIDDSRKLTRLGTRLASLPIDPRLGRIVLAAVDEGCVTEILTIVSALSVQDPRDRPFEKRQAADELHAEFNHEKSDFMAWVNLWAFIEVQRKNLSNSQFRKMCKQRFLSVMRIREWWEVRQQLQSLCNSMKIRQNDAEAPYDNIHRALLTGLLSNVAVKTDKQDYLGTRNRHLQIFPGSGLHKQGPKWLVAGEVSETSRLYARQVAGVSVEWIERLAEHLLQRTHRDPHWGRKSGVVAAWEQSTLYGLIVNPKKRVNYAPINPVMAREIFIRDGLVTGNVITSGKFLRHNMALVDEIQTQEEKSRRRDIVVDPEELVRFYDALLPDDVNNTVAFETWRKKYEQSSPRGLFFSRDLLLRDDAEEVSQTAFPEQLEFGGVVLPLKYHFSPGDADDGVTLLVPVEVLNRVSSAQCEWLVPGMLEEKLTALIKSLPKALRRNFVPAPDFGHAAYNALAEKVAAAQTPGESLLDELNRHLHRISGVPFAVTEFDPSSLPVHLLMRFEVLGDGGKVIETSRDLASLQKKFAGKVEESLLAFGDDTLERDVVTDWNFGDLPESVEVGPPAAKGQARQAAIRLRGHPALMATPDGVALKLFATPQKAALEMRTGVRELYRIVQREEIRYLQRKLPNIDLLSLRFAPIAGKKVLIEDIINAALDATFVDSLPFPRTREAFQQQISQHRAELVPTASRICSDLEQVLENHRQVAKKIDGSVSLSWIEPIADIRDQISRLLYPGFISACGPDRLRRLTVYFQAMLRRLDAIDHAPDKDRRRRAELLPVWERFKVLPVQRDDPPDYAQRYQALRWSFEELRISLFAQELGTAEKVSVSKLENRLSDLGG
ncbi:MAG: ATP-dependent RNA helicase HrpA, partial [Gammaproteobacteria bacterium]|nr:ATP-dependent RNA helicase HrpA [Gammaproteobacteria bacterium]